MCIICQEPGEKLNEVQYKATGKTMLSVATKHYNDRVLRRLNSIAASDDCVATDAKYHFKCWVLMKRYVQQKDNSIETQEIEDIRYVVADIEIINILKQELDDPSHKIVTTVSVKKLYRELLLELEVKKEDLHNSYRKYLKQLILENAPGVSFKKSPRANEPERICSESAEDHAIEVALQQNEVDKFKEIYNATETLRTELEKMSKLKFSGSFSDFTTPMDSCWSEMCS